MVRALGRANWLWRGVALGALAGLAGCGSSANVGNIKILASEEVVAQTKVALLLLEERAPDGYRKAQKHIGLIIEWPRSEVDVDGQPPTLRIKRETALQSLTWYAALIAHEAMHCELHQRELDAVARGSSYATALAEVERICIDYMLDVAERIGAPPEEIASLAAEDGGHNDADGDGDVDWIDWLLNDW